MLREPPAKGSLRESILLLYVMKLQEIMYTRDLALAQLIVDRTNTEKFKTYQRSMFPWIETAETRDKMAHLKALMDDIKKGPLTVTPMVEKKAQSRLAKKVSRQDYDDAARRRQDNVYKKLGSMF